MSKKRPKGAEQLEIITRGRNQQKTTRKKKKAKSIVAKNRKKLKLANCTLQPNGS